MSMNAIKSENILQSYGGNNVNSLNHILEFDVDDELHLLQKSQYFDDETLLKQLATKTNTLKILSLPTENKQQTKITEYFDSILERSFFSRRSHSLLDSLNTEVH